jgi:hypothetical protein
MATPAKDWHIQQVFCPKSPSKILSGPLDIISQLPSLNKLKAQEVRMPQHPKKLLDQVRACPELVETVVAPTTCRAVSARRQDFWGIVLYTNATGF